MQNFKRCQSRLIGVNESGEIYNLSVSSQWPLRSPEYLTEKVRIKHKKGFICWTQEPECASMSY